jgi:hypothetical protein
MRRLWRVSLLLALPLVLGAAPATDMNALAERYVKLVLAVGQHDDAFVDAYYGPPEWKTAATAAGKRPLEELGREADGLANELAATAQPDDEMLRLRRDYLRAQVHAVSTRIRMLQGARLDFDAESRELYDAVAPTYDEAHFAQALQRLDTLVPGEVALADRVETLRQRVAIPPDKLDAVFKAAIAECRARTVAHVTLPAGEEFRLEYVTGKPWSGYNWYQGKFHSLIQINTELPIFIDRAVDLACHEGYPGHHVYNVLLEKHLVTDRGWREFTVYPLFSPQSLIAEGSANFGIDVAFPGDERMRFERDRLYPLAGLDQSLAPKYHEVLLALDELSYAGNEAARRYLNGKMSKDDALAWLVKYTLTSRPRAEQRVRFFDTYRSYVINYNYGKDLVRRYVEAAGGTDSRPDVRWKVFGDLISSPRLPSGLTGSTSG